MSFVAGVGLLGAPSTAAATAPVCLAFGEQRTDVSFLAARRSIRDVLLFPARYATSLVADPMYIPVEWASPRIRGAARALGLDPTGDPSLPPYERGLALFAEMGKAMNRTGPRTFEFVRASFHGNAVVTSMIDNLEREANAHSYGAIWQEDPAQGNQRLGELISINVNTVFARSPQGAQTFLTLVHEVAHQAKLQEWAPFPGRGRALMDYLNEALPLLFQDELHAYRAEHRALQELERAGVRVPVSSIPTVARELFPLFGTVTEEQLINAIRNLGYEQIYSVALVRLWAEAYARADLAELRNAFGLADASASRQAVDAVFSTSLHRQALNDVARAAHDRSLLTALETEYSAAGNDVALARVRRRLTD